MKKKIAFLLVVCGALSSCTVLKEYEKVNINDPDMELTTKAVDRNISTMHLYREASAGANGGKTGGGCGCN